MFNIRTICCLWWTLPDEAFRSPSPRNGEVEQEKKEFDFSNELKNYLSKKISGKILGPVQAPIYKIKKKYRNRLLIRASKSMTIQNNLSKALKNFKIQPEIKLTVDVDPISFN